MNRTERKPMDEVRMLQKRLQRFTGAVILLMIAISYLAARFASTP